MIIEVHRSPQMNGLGYNLKKLHECKAEIIATKWIPKDATGEEIAKIFQANTQHARQKHKYAHLNINPAIEDWKNGLTVEQLAEIGRYTMKKMFPGVPYIVFIHRDIDRWHAHAVCPLIRRDGTYISDRFEHRRAMKLSREIETLWNLEKALEKAEERRINRAEPIEYESGSLAQKIGDVLSLAKTYRFKRLGELNAFLSLYNCGVEQVDNDKKRGLSYYVLKDGQRVGRAIVATKIHGGALASIEKHMKNASISNENLSLLRLKLAKAINNAINYDEFKAELEGMQVRLVERIGREGNILGITFVDDENKAIANGSNVGREYSYANIMKRFNDSISQHTQGNIFFDNTPVKETTITEETEKISLPDIIPDISGLFFAGKIAGSVNKRKKRQKWGF